MKPIIHCTDGRNVEVPAEHASITPLEHPDDIQAVQPPKKAPDPSGPGSPLIKSLLWIIFCCLAPVPATFGQIIYAYGVTQNSTGFLFKIDLANCTYCPVAFMNDNNCQDLILLPNGNVVSVDGRFIKVFEPPNQNATFLLETLPQPGMSPSFGGVSKNKHRKESKNLPN